MTRCIIRSTTVMSFTVISGEVCTVSFGENAKFHYEILNDGKVLVTRKNISIKLGQEEFKHNFKILD